MKPARIAHGLVFVLVAAALAGVAPATEPEHVQPPASAEADFVDHLIQRDMFYGSDDYFGNDRDLSYVDHVRPTTTPETPPAAEETSVSSPRRDRPDDRSSQEEGSDGSSSDGTVNTGGGIPDGGGEEDVGEEETEPDEPDEPGEEGGGG